MNRNPLDFQLMEDLGLMMLQAIDEVSPFLFSAKVFVASLIIRTIRRHTP